MSNKLEQTIQRLVASKSDEEAKQVYAEWQSYDSDLDAYGYIAPQLMANKLIAEVDEPDALIYDAGCGTGKVGAALHIAQFAFELEEVLLYAEVSLLKEQLSLYLDQRVAPGGALNREAFGLYKSKRGYYAKAGQFFLPYGFRLEDDTAFIRQITGFNFNNPDRGVEVGIDAAKFSANLALSNGTPGVSETDRGKQVSFRSSYVETDWRFVCRFAHGFYPVAG